MNYATLPNAAGLSTALAEPFGGVGVTVAGFGETLRLGLIRCHQPAPGARVGGGVHRSPGHLRGR